MSLKAKLRQKFKVLVSEFSESQKNNENQVITDWVINYLKKNNLTKIGIYNSMPNEVSTIKIVDFCLNNAIEVFVPKMCPYYSLEFYQIFENSNWEQNNPYNIKEPKELTSKVDLNDLQIIIVPILGFDDKKNRLGRGKGYYDRTLVKLSNTIKIGLAFSCQKHQEVLPIEENDVPLDFIVTGKFTL
ncbi:5-formyltetrahydrofolate cyclo-ligase [Spiroplasma alleghenense]|uniref:5-formyltetrahydrofolate cyclo-ligase n=1 Tax=Spiroplasma alleghenense TaxID=216931 RepID=A0A345Z3Y8_9MOLU|nr:5-formyltetrahydrofolate cyclo-ligase [Spiroplasma alleghenense]AXK51317.1 5-formyltetrahydrofolate cyclo-ligase [Spiroplasma alleghenense]